MYSQGHFIQEKVDSSHLQHHHHQFQANSVISPSQRPLLPAPPSHHPSLVDSFLVTTSPGHGYKGSCSEGKAPLSVASLLNSPHTNPNGSANDGEEEEGGIIRRSISDGPLLYNRSFSACDSSPLLLKSTTLKRFPEDEGGEPPPGGRRRICSEEIHHFHSKLSSIHPHSTPSSLVAPTMTAAAAAAAAGSNRENQVLLSSMQQRSQAAKKAELNRASQKAFRQRKERYVKFLEAKSSLLDILLQRIEQTSSELIQVKSECRRLLWPQADSSIFTASSFSTSSLTSSISTSAAAMATSGGGGGGRDLMMDQQDEALLREVQDLKVRVQQAEKQRTSSSTTCQN